MHYPTFLQRQVLDAARRIHRSMGSNGSREQYQSALAAELTANGLRVATDLLFPETYADVVVDHCIDCLVEDTLILELRTAAQALESSHYVFQLDFYLRLAGRRHGLLLDFTGDSLTTVSISENESEGLAS